MNTKLIKKFLGHPLFSGSAVMIGGSMVVNVINYIYHLIVGRMLGPVNYGILASLFSILYIVSIVPGSASVAIVKFVSSAKDQKERFLVYKAINRLIVTIGLVLGVLIVLVSPIIASFLHISNVFLVALVSPVMFFSLITLTNQATSQGVLEFRGYVLPNLASSLVKIIFGVLLIYLGFSVLGAMFGVVIGAILSYLVSLPYLKKVLVSNHSKNGFEISRFLKYSFPVLLQALAFTSLFTSDLILAKHFLSPFDAGIYAALSTLGKIIFFAASPISSVMFPVIAGRHANGEKYHKVFWASFFATLTISLGIVVGYYLFPNIAIGALYGAAYMPAKTSLVWMGLFILVYTLTILLVNFSLSIGKTAVTIIPVCAAVVQIVLIWYYHGSITQIIQASLVVSVLMFFGVAVYLGYNSLKKKVYETV